MEMLTPDEMIKELAINMQSAKKKTDLNLYFS